MACLGYTCSNYENLMPVCASMLYETPGVIYVSIDPDVWKICCNECQQKTEHKCSLKKLKSRFKGLQGPEEERKKLSLTKIEKRGLNDEKRDLTSDEKRNLASDDKRNLASDDKRNLTSDEKRNEAQTKKAASNEEKETNRREHQEEKDGEEEEEKSKEKKKEEEKSSENKKEEEKTNNEKKEGENEGEKAKAKAKEDEKKKPTVGIPPEPIDDSFCTCSDTPKKICDCEVYKPLNFMFELEVTGEFKPAYVPKAKKGKYQ